MFKECQLKYRYRYVDRIPEERGNTDALHFGSYIHKILEDGVASTTLAELINIAESVKKDYTFSETYNPKIEVCLKNFLKFNASLEETVATEMVYEVVYDEERDIKLNGIIDRIIKGSDGGYLVIDYKTSKRELTELDLYQDRQMQGYAYAVHKKMGVPFSKIVVAHYYPLTNNLVTAKFSPNQIQHYLREKVDQVWKIRKMKKVDFFPMENQYCNWCGYKNVCPKFHPQPLVEQRLQHIVESKKKAKAKKDSK
jgi:putative RecB family exonuclease